MKLATDVNFKKPFWCNLCCYRHIAVSFDSGYAASVINCAEISFMKLAADVYFIKLFWCNLCCYRLIALSFDLGYAARDINYTKKSFMKLAAGFNFIKLFSAYLSFMGLSTPCLVFASKSCFQG